MNTLAKTNGEGRAKEEDKDGAKCESSISMGTFAFQLNFCGSPLCSTFVYRRQTRRRLSGFSLSYDYHDIPSFFFFFFFLTTNKAIDFVIFPFKLYRQKVSKLNLVLPSKQEESESSGCTFVTIDSSNRRLILRV